MKLGIPRERREGERRVAATPETVKQLAALGVEILLEEDAGAAAGYPDLDYSQAGAHIVPELDPAQLDVLAHVRPLDPDTARSLKRGAVSVGLASPSSELPTVQALADAGVTSFALELVPRISRAQSMDALSSQALVAGYRCVLEAAIRLPRFFPLYMTAAGTVPPARVLVLGAGVAGLQAIGTARRLGAVVEAYDTRPAVKEQVESLGAKFAELPLETADAQDKGGYAKAQSEEFYRKQREFMGRCIAAADALITTAAVPGRQAPMLVTAAMVEQMRPGSVVVDLAAESGGNVEGSHPGRVVRIGDAQVWGGANVPAQMPGPASRLYAQNVVNLVTLMTRAGEDGSPPAFAPDFDDEIVAGSCVTHDGAIRHEPTRTALEGPATGEATP